MRKSNHITGIFYYYIGLNKFLWSDSQACNHVYKKQQHILPSWMIKYALNCVHSLKTQNTSRQKKEEKILSRSNFRQFHVVIETLRFKIKINTRIPK